MHAFMRTFLPMRFLVTGLAVLCLQLLLMLHGAVAAALGSHETPVSITRPDTQGRAVSVDGRGVSFPGHGAQRHCLADPAGRACCDRRHDVVRHAIWRPGARALPRPKGRGLVPGQGATGKGVPASSTIDVRSSILAQSASPSLAFGTFWHGRRLLHLCCRLLI